MLDRATHQGAGLLALAGSPSPRLMAMVSHGDTLSELPLLWGICSALVDLGYAVTVLDATTRESEGNPGLDQILEYDYWNKNEDQDVPAWKVIPAAMGLQSLCATAYSKGQNFHHLGSLFPHEGALIVYGKVECLIPLLHDTTVRPLLAFTPLKTSLITSYRALKHLLLKGRLEPTVVNLVQEPQVTPVARIGNVAASLSDCAKNFLGYEVKALTVSASADDEQPCAEIQHLALRLLESAMPLTATVNHPHFAPQAPLIGSAYLLGSH